MDLFSALGSDDFLPHGHCYLWIPSLVWLQVSANLAIGIAYVGISGSLLVLTRRLRGLPFNGIYLAFGLFIVSCGMTHFMDAVTVWRPVYWVDGGIRAFTAAASVGTCFYLIAFFPRILALAEVLVREREVSRVELERIIHERDELLVRESAARREAEERGKQLDEAYADLDALFTHAPVGLVLFDRDLRYRRINRALALDINGLPVDAHLGKRVAEVLPGLPAEMEETFRTVLETGQPAPEREIVGETPARPGEQRVWKANYFPVRDRKGTVIGVGNTVVDVTEEKRANEQFRALVENLPDLAWTARPDGHIDFYNRRWYEYTGTTFESMQGWGWERVHDPQMLPGVMERWNRSLQNGEPFEMEFPLRGADGTFRWFLTRIRPIRDERGNILRWFGNNTDIDESIKARHERESLLEQLQNTVRFSEMFVGILGHDLRNPLSAITTSAQHLLRRSADEKIVTPAGRILASAERMARMIDQILDFTRIRLGAGLSLHPKEMDLLKVLLSSRDELQTVHPNATIEVESSGDLRGTWDKDRLEQVISNLIGNAMQHGQPGEKIMVRLDGSAPELVSWSVRNAGVVDPAIVAVLFEPFRGSSQKGVSSRGLGLGLYITQQIVNAHGGQIGVETDGAAGTIFTVRLPRHPPAEREISRTVF